MDAFRRGQQEIGHHACMLVVDGDKIDEAVLHEVWHMAKNAGMYEHSLDEIFVPSYCHNTVTIDNSIQCSLVGRCVFTGFSAAGTGGSQDLRERAATFGILPTGFAMGLLENASILAELGHHLTVFIEASKCVEWHFVNSQRHRGIHQQWQEQFLHSPASGARHNRPEFQEG
jgi:hypothetical protein